MAATSFDAIGCIIAVWLLNVFGIRPAVWVSYVTGVGLLVTLVIFMFVPYFTGDWHSSNMTWLLHGWTGWKTAFVWLFLMGWSIYAAEICATFAPEYKDTRRDTTIALRSAGVFTLMVALLFPLGVGGVTGVPPLSQQEGEFYVPALTKLVGSGLAGAGSPARRRRRQLSRARSTSRPSPRSWAPAWRVSSSCC